MASASMLPELCIGRRAALGDGDAEVGEQAHTGSPSTDDPWSADMRWILHRNRTIEGASGRRNAGFAAARAVRRYPATTPTAIATEPGHAYEIRRTRRRPAPSSCWQPVIGARRPPPPPEPKSAAAGTVATAERSTSPAGIDWFDGDVDAAFAAAQICQQAACSCTGAPNGARPARRSSRRSSTSASSRSGRSLFVPVYLDGDTPSAQKHGEHFGVVGYPTMILFRPDGTEITRLPGGVDVARYATMLDVALADARPGRRNPGGGTQRRRGRPTTTGACSLFIRGARTTAAFCRRSRQLATFRTVADALPGQTARRVRAVLLRISRRSGRRVGTEGASARWSRPRRRAQAGC